MQSWETSWTMVITRGTEGWSYNVFSFRKVYFSPFFFAWYHHSCIPFHSPVWVRLCFHFCHLLSVPLFLSLEQGVTIHLFKWPPAMPVMSVSCSFFHLSAQSKVGCSVDMQHVFINAPVGWVHVFCNDFELPEGISESKASLMQSLRTGPWSNRLGSQHASTT